MRQGLRAACSSPPRRRDGRAADRIRTRRRASPRASGDARHRWRPRRARSPRNARAQALRDMARGAEAGKAADGMPAILLRSGPAGPTCALAAARRRNRSDERLWRQQSPASFSQTSRRGPLTRVPPPPPTVCARSPSPRGLGLRQVLGFAGWSLGFAEALGFAEVLGPVGIHEILRSKLAVRVEVELCEAARWPSGRLAL